MDVEPNSEQPRKVFEDEALIELSESIKEHGVITPIIVAPPVNGYYKIIAGERRVRASHMAGLEKIPAIIRNLNDEQMMEIALLENLQRENLSSIEEAIAYRSMIEKLNLTQEELAKKVGKSRSHITNILGLLRLPNEVRSMITNNELTMGHARTISKLESEEEMIKLAKQIVEEKLPVREVEKISPDMKKKVQIERKVSTSSSEYYS
jgi:ParB family chromosome partitioning protein